MRLHIYTHTYTCTVCIRESGARRFYTVNPEQTGSKATSHLRRMSADARFQPWLEQLLFRLTLVIFRTLPKGVLNQTIDKIITESHIYHLLAFYGSLSSLPCSQQLSRSSVPFTIHINPLKTKRRPLYLNTQFVPRSKHFSSRL